jgi:Escherichia/Staphylococcus phage prohead protease
MDNYFSFEIKEVGDAGEFTGIASVYGVEDLGGDIVDKGAFTKTVSENPTIPILWQHQSGEVIGQGEVKESQGKLMISGKLDMEDATAQKAFRKMKNGMIRGLSIGYKSVKSTFEELEDRFIRHLQEVKLFEVSIVTFPMLPAAQITRTKQQEEESERKFSALVARVEALEAKVSEPPSPTPEPVDDHSAVTALLEDIGKAIH